MVCSVRCYLCVSEVASRLSPFLKKPINEEQIKKSKSLVLTAYYRRSSSLNVTNQKQSDNPEKIKRVHQTLCEFIRHPDEILSNLFQRRAVTQQEQELIKSQTTIYQWASHLLDVLCAKPVSAYKYFLEALDSTQQHHLHCLLEEKG